MPASQPFAVRLIRLLTGTLSAAVLVVVAAVWVAVSRPFDPGQLSPVAVRAAASIALPSYPGAVTVLTYHAVSDHVHSPSALTRRLFGEHMAALAAAGYHTVRLRDVENLINRRPVRLPEKPLLLTFDDGSLTDWTTVDPVLKEHHFTAVAFLTTERVVAPGTPSFYLSTRQVRAMWDTGRWEFGSQTAALNASVPVAGDVQPALTNLILVSGRPETLDQWRDRVSADLARSQEFFRRTLGHPATAFAYPYGDGGAETNAPQIAQELPRLVERAGFDVAFTGANVPTGHIDAVTASAPRWLMPRIGVRSTTSVEDLLRTIRGSIPVAPPHDLTTLSWVGDVADCHSTPGAGITVRTTAGGYGSCAPGGINTSQWINYTLSARLHGVGRKATAVLAVRDGIGAGHHGRVEIAIGEGQIVIRQQVGSGPRSVLASAAVPAGASSDVTVTAEVRDNHLMVYLPRMAPVQATFDPRLHEGGVAFALAAAADHPVTFATPTLTPA